MNTSRNIIIDPVIELKYAVNLKYAASYKGLKLIVNQYLKEINAPILFFNIQQNKDKECGVLFQIDLLKEDYEKSPEIFDMFLVRIIKDISKIRELEIINNINLLGKIPTLKEMNIKEDILEQSNIKRYKP